QYQPVFGAGGEHAVGLTGTHGDQVVDQHPDVGLVAARAPAVQTLREAGSVQPGEQPLGGSFLVTGGAVDQAGEEHPADHLGFQRVLQVLGIEIVIFDGVARTQDVGVFHAAYRPHDLQLHIEGEGRGNPVGIQLVGGQAFGLDEHLVLILVGKAMDLVFDRWAIARTDPLDDAGVHRRAIQVVADDLVGPLIGVGDPTVDLL